MHTHTHTHKKGRTTHTKEGEIYIDRENINHTQAYCKRIHWNTFLFFLSFFLSCLPFLVRAAHYFGKGHARRAGFPKVNGQQQRERTRTNFPCASRNAKFMRVRFWPKPTTTTTTTTRQFKTRAPKNFFFVLL